MQIMALLINWMGKNVGMTQSNNLVQNKNRYRIDGFHIIDSEGTPVEKIYIREILDSAAAEFKQSKLTSQQKLEILSELGIEPLTSVLDACYRSNNKSYSAADEAQMAFLFLSKSVFG